MCHPPRGVTASLSTSANATGDAVGDTYVSIEGLQGSDFNDSLAGDANANRIEGLSGDDVLEGSAGNDTLVGGLGSDTFGVDAAGDVITELSGEGFDTVYSSIDYTLGANLEGLNLTGSAVNGSRQRAGQRDGRQRAE